MMTAMDPKIWIHSESSSYKKHTQQLLHFGLEHA